MDTFLIFPNTTGKPLYILGADLFSNINLISMPDKNVQELVKDAIDSQLYHFVYDSFEAAVSPEKFDLYCFETEEEANQFMIDTLNGYAPDEAVPYLAYSYAEDVSTFFEHIKNYHNYYFGQSQKNQLNNNNILSQLNLTIMETEDINTQQTPMEKNLSYLEKQLQYLGFGEDVKTLLQTAISQNTEKESFNIETTQHFSTPSLNKNDPHSKSIATYELNFNKDKREHIENRYFYLNSYSVYNGKNEMRININSNQKNITVKEAFNLLEGRSVYKRELLKQDGDKYNAWIKFDFDHINEKNQPEIHRYTDNYGFDISAELKKLPLKENTYEDKHQQLIVSLEKGNLQGVTVLVDGQEKQMFMESNPQYKNFNLYELNEENKLIPVRAETLSNNESEQQERKSGFKM